MSTEFIFYFSCVSVKTCIAMNFNINTHQCNVQDRHDFVEIVKILDEGGGKTANITSSQGLPFYYMSYSKNRLKIN